MVGLAINVAAIKGLVIRFNGQRNATGFYTTIGMIFSFLTITSFDVNALCITVK
jgi:hypothetical protein